MPTFRSARPPIRTLAAAALCLAAVTACGRFGGGPDTTLELPPAENRSIPEIQGAGHRSPYAERRVRTRGVVVAADREEAAIWIQDPRGDGDDATSDGLYVVGALPELPTLGMTVELTGTVREMGGERGALTLTALEADAFEILDRTGTPPEPVVIGRDGRVPPSEVVDDDGLQRFEPALDGIDFYESLENMRVEVREPRVVGPTNQYGDFTVVPDRGDVATGATRLGNLLLRPGDTNPEALVVGSRLTAGDTPDVDVGDLFFDPIRGMLGYDFGHFRLLAYGKMPTPTPSRRQAEVTELLAGPERLTIATWNVLNLAATDDEERHLRIARGIVGSLRTPDIVALQEIQDDNGAFDDDTVSAGRTLEKLLRAIQAAGGPRYRYRQLDPRDDQEGGQPGGNIRVVLLFDPERVEALDVDGPDDRIDILWQRSGIRLQPSPARLRDPAFRRDASRGWSASRLPLVAQFRFAGRDLIVINAHLRSKGGDDPVMGATQPRLLHSEEQRTAQARAIRGFVERLLDADPDARIVVLGDLNEHEFRTPLRVLEGAGLTNMIDFVGYRDRYTYNYRGNSQVLDHVLISRRLLREARPEADVVHNSADFSRARAASDHDPMIVRLSFD